MAVTAIPDIEAPAGRGCRVLVVEDDHLIALDIEHHLARLGFEPVVAHSGREALAVVTRDAIDLVLMDIRLDSELDGIDTARAIRAAADLPIVYLTAYADNDTLERARATEPYGYVLKPFQARELKAAIEMALQRHSGDKLRSAQQQLQRFLADASTRLAATLDYRTVARGAAELLVPRYADSCLIQLAAVDERIPRFAFVYPEVGPIEPPPDALAALLRDSRGVLFRDFHDTSALRDLLGDQFVGALRDRGAHSLIGVPLVARAQPLGALILVAAHARMRYGASDLAFVADFALRLALSLDNALLYRAAEHAIRMRDDVLAIVSHDLRTPLSTILMLAEQLAEREDADAEAIADRILKSARRMARLIGDLVDASAVNAGKLALVRAAHRAADIAREAIEPFRAQAEAKAVSLREWLVDETVWIDCDRDRIVQATANLIDNAIKFTPARGTVTVTVDRRHEGVVFEVRDTGPGIASTELPHLFERFWRARGQREGAGLGLYIAQGVVAAHGRTLVVDSTIGKGTRFWFSLPEATGRDREA